MHITQLQLRDYRNYSQADLRFYPGKNIISGPNGQGKTNLVEAINYLAVLSSHRVSSDAALIRQSATSAIIRIQLAHAQREILLEAEIVGSGKNKAQVNRNNAKLRDFPQYVSTVLFAPEDLLLIRGEPAQRRRFIDELVTQRSPRMAGVQSDYERVLKQRNTLLKSLRVADLKSADLSTLEIWDDRLISLGIEIMTARSKTLELLQPHVHKAYAAIAGAEHNIELHSIHSLSVHNIDTDAPKEHDTATVTPDETHFKEMLTNLRVKEVERGMTLIGPHRDDIVFSLNGLPAKGYASHGETWTFALALKIGSAELLRKESRLGDPILLLDDVFAELDTRRRQALARLIDDYEQVIITVAVPEDIPPELEGHHIVVERGSAVNQ